MRDESMPEAHNLKLNGHEAKFFGAMLSEASSHETTHTHAMGTLPTQRCSACRWFEVRIYRSAGEPAMYYVEMRGRSILEGETDRGRIESTPSAHWVVECLVQHRNGSEAFIPNVSRRALAEAAAVDVGIDDAFVNRAVA